MARWRDCTTRGARLVDVNDFATEGRLEETKRRNMIELCKITDWLGFTKKYSEKVLETI